jgi:hypothetical protein
VKKIPSIKKMEFLKENPVGLYVKFKNILGETIEGEVFGYDEDYNLLALCKKKIIKKKKR